MVNGRNKYRIKDIFDLSAGGDVDKEHFSAYKTSEHRYPIYSNSLENHGLYGYTSNPKYSADSVTITGRGSVGHAEYREDEFDAIIRLLVLKPKSSNVCAQFVADYINNCVDFSLESTGVPQLTAPQIMNVELELPQYDEQKEVTTVLADVSSLIDMLGKQISKKKAIKQGTMQELLTGNRRLPGFSGEWETKKLEDYCSLITKQTGFDYSAYIKPALITRKMPNTFPMIQTINFRGRKFTFETDYYIPQSVAMQFPNIVLNKKCVLFSIVGASVGNVGLYPGSITAFCGGAIGITRFRNEQDAEWVFNYMSSPDGQSQIQYVAKGGAQATVTIADIRNFKIPTPEKGERDAISGILENMDYEIEALEKKLKKYRQVKQGMMQQLLTGKICLEK